MLNDLTIPKTTHQHYYPAILALEMTTQLFTGKAALGS